MTSIDLDDQQPPWPKKTRRSSDDLPDDVQSLWTTIQRSVWLMIPDVAIQLRQPTAGNVGRVGEDHVKGTSLIECCQWIWSAPGQKGHAVVDAMISGILSRQ